MKGCQDTCPGESSQLCQRRRAPWASRVPDQPLPSDPVAPRPAVTSQVPGRHSWALPEPPGYSPGGHLWEGSDASLRAEAAEAPKPWQWD